MSKYCTYVTYHVTGKFYVGKGSTARVSLGNYKGSGTKLLDAFKKYPRNEWVTEIVSLHESEEEAYLQEALWVDSELIKDPNCQNIILGGKGGSWRKQSPEEIARRTAKMTATKRSPEGKAKMSKASRECSKRPEVHARRVRASKRLWNDAEMRAQILASRIDSYGDDWKRKLSEASKVGARRPFRVEVHGKVYQRQVDACRELGLHRRVLRKLPSFRELA